MISFALLQIIVQLLSGLILTNLYVPEFTEQPNTSNRAVQFGNAPTLSFWLTFFPAIVAYVLSQRVGKTRENHSVKR